MPTVDVWPEEPAEQDGAVTVAAVLERESGARARLWYRLPASHRSALTASCDPFVLGAVFSAMRAGARLAVHGAVSPSLIDNLSDFQDAWAAWRRALYRKVDISADTEREAAPPPGGECVQAFSGGMDSSFTAWRHRAGAANRRRHNLRAGVMIHGFDIPLAQEEVFGRAAAKSSAILASVGMELIPVATNFRELRDPWLDAHGAGLASCLALLGGRFGAGLIASSFPYGALSLPYGSNPLTDPMMSSRAFRIAHDGAAFSTLQKTRALADWPELLQNLRVCWQGPEKDRNCCRCQKCVTYMLYFRIMGRPVPPCFERELTDRDIRRLRYADRDMIHSTDRLVFVARKEGVRASWVRALALSVWLNRGRLAWSRTGGRAAAVLWRGLVAAASALKRASRLKR